MGSDGTMLATLGIAVAFWAPAPHRSPLHHARMIGELSPPSAPDAQPAEGADMAHSSTVDIENPHRKLVPASIIEHESLNPTGRVLLIYTGGTLGMTKTDGAWLPNHESGNLGRLIMRMPEFCGRRRTRTSHS